ncbi:uncharacterized protein LOC107421696 [Ziziphus jujuba]|uniref:Uncharacterized protein LOC107421696 n=1 Tax=Ziziphus jujuba TaxID=326968 RepID=A0A6P4AE07_ZIZJJ|nr:uncharacterized protein LOC107421696 [Ziziphus jujuba]
MVCKEQKGDDMVSLESTIKNVSPTKSHMLITVLVSMAILLGFLFGSFIYMSRNYGPESKPFLLRLQSIDASNFDISSSPLLAKWNVELGIENRKENLKINVDEVTSLLYYKDHEISCALVMMPFKVLSQKQRSIELHFDRKACGEEQPFLDDGVLNELLEERRKGKIMLTLKMEMEVAFDMLRSSWSWQGRLKLYCPPMEVEFEIGKGEGKLANDTQIPITCTVL